MYANVNCIAAVHRVVNAVHVAARNEPHIGALVWCSSLSSMTLALAFVFGNSLRTVYESVVFLFIVRPYKVGARLPPHRVAAAVALCCCCPGAHQHS